MNVKTLSNGGGEPAGMGHDVIRARERQRRDPAPRAQCTA